MDIIIVALLSVKKQEKADHQGLSQQRETDELATGSRMDESHLMHLATSRT